MFHNVRDHAYYSDKGANDKRLSAIGYLAMRANNKQKMNRIGRENEQRQHYKQLTVSTR
jgi:hypothetical protein